MVSASISETPDIGPAPTAPDTADEREHARRLRRATQLVRARQSLRTLPLVLIGGVLFISTLWNEAPRANVLLWIGLVFACAWARSRVCKRVLARLEDAGDAELAQHERWLALSSAPAFVAMGSGFWLVAAPGSERAVIVVTLLCCIYSFGSAINASVHFRSFVVNTVLNLGQGIAFLLLAGGWQPTVGVSVIGTGILLLYFGRENARAFAESIRIRAENVRLVEQLNREKQLVEQALATADAANLGKSRFLAAASHDLRQPLHALSLFVGSLAMHIKGEQAEHLLARIDETTDVLREQFNALLDMSRFDAGAVEIELTTFPLDTVLERVVDGVRDDAARKDLDFVVSVPHVFVRSDRLLVERVASNLVINAVTYTAAGSVSVVAKVEGDSALVTVRDTGVGIAAADQARIFEDFSQLHNRARQRRHGAGLGLAIVRRIDALLGLGLSVTSAPGEGTTFHFRLPLAPEKPADTSAPAPAHRGLAHAGAPVVWAIDDDADVAEAVAMQLRAWGCEVTVGASRADMETARCERGAWPDLTLIDDMLGEEEDESGLDIARWLRTHMPGEAIVIVTGNVDPRRQAELRHSGFRFLIKPTPPEDLRRLVAEAAARIGYD